MKIFSIIVTHNGGHQLDKCLQHLSESSIQPEIFIVDNASTDQTLQIINSYRKSIHFVQNKSNIGFGQANNIGIKYAINKGADYIFLLNQDVYIFPDTISLLISALQKNQDFGILSPLQLHASMQQIEPTFEHFLQHNFTKKKISNMLHPKNNFDTYKPYSMRFVNAASWMITANCIQKTGLFHEVFFHYGEDNHYSSRVQFHKMKIGVLPASHIIHDCKQNEKENHQILIRKMKNVPLYTLLDLRKPFPLAFLLGFLKWKRLKKKILEFSNASDKEIIDEQRKWFRERLPEIKTIRKKTAKEWEGNKNL